MPNHIFISYARALADHIRQRDFGVWMDDCIDSGDDWWHTIVENFPASAALIVVMTPVSHKSRWVRRELLLGLRWDKPIFPLLLRGEGFPLLDDRQYADVTVDRMLPARFLARLHQVVPLPEAPQPPTPEPAPQKEKPDILPREHPLEPEMTVIPAGDFLIGGNPAKDSDASPWEQPQHNLYLPDYYIARTPITNAQYAAFVKATDHDLPDHWEHGSPPTGKDALPVVNVSRYDAVTYCDWLAQLTGRSCCLPSEAEWEKTTRGADGRIYHWGDRWDAEPCNNIEAGIEEITPVGAYPEGASPYGLLGMTGDILEWTCSLWGKNWKPPDFAYLYDPGGRREGLDGGDNVLWVLRGSAFGIPARWVRCASRGRYALYAATWQRGCRLVASPVRLRNPDTRRP